MRKLVKMSIVVASLVATSAMAADKGIDIAVTGQAALYYQTVAGNGNGEKDLFDSSKSRANAGLQLNLDADLKNNFTFGSQITYLGTSGLEKNVVGDTMQDINAKAGSTGINDDIYLSQLYIAKKIANTTVKIGRQELPMSLSPFAYSEDWNVFKNTFDAILAVNTDLPDTTVVGAYVSGGNYNAPASNMAQFGDLKVAGMDIDGTAYMLTVQNKSLPMATVTATYYGLQNIATAVDADVLWGDVTISDKSLPMGLKVGVQGGSIMPDSASNLKDTNAFGARISIKPMDPLTLCVAYSNVNDGDVPLVNVGGVKTPLYTQMIANQNPISKDADTIMVKADYNMGDFGAITLQDAFTSAGSKNRENAGRTAGKNADYNDLELVYKIKAGGVQYFAAIANRTWSEETVANSQDSENWIRVWGRYNF